MSYTAPRPGRYMREADGAEVTVGRATGTSGIDTVTVKGTAPGSRTSHVRLENFWRKYQPWPDGAKRYRVTFDRIGRNHNVPVFDSSLACNAGELAEQICRYANRHLRSRDVEVVIIDDLQNGYISCGGRPGGGFTISELAPAGGDER